MANIALRFVPEAIKDRRVFTAGAHTLSARWENDEYRVYSYRALIAVAKGNDRVWITDQKYSQTTSRHTTKVRQGFADELKVSLEEARA
jgi:hypothetical protein